MKPIITVFILTIGLLLSGSDSTTVWPWNVLAGSAMMAAAGLVALKEGE